VLSIFVLVNLISFCHSVSDDLLQGLPVFLQHFPIQWKRGLGYLIQCFGSGYMIEEHVIDLIQCEVHGGIVDGSLLDDGSFVVAHLRWSMAFGFEVEFS